MRDTQTKASAEAFRLGHRDAGRFARLDRVLDMSLTPRDVANLRPTIGPLSVSAYLNGWDDGVRGDTFRLTLIHQLEQAGV